MKKRTVSAFFKEMMLRGLRLLVWLWIGLLWLLLSAAAGTARTSATSPERPLCKKRTDCEQRTKRVHFLLALMRGGKFGAVGPGDRALPAFATIAGPVK
jgi:hypothetical protein